MARQDDQGSFLTGFTLGIFAGAAGYYLFATDKGKKLRTELNKEWEQARSQVGTETFQYSSIRDVLYSIAKAMQIDVPAKKDKSSTKKITRTSTSSKNKFKGL